VTFDHKGETPGLGAEINTSVFENMFRVRSCMKPASSSLSAL